MKEINKTQRTPYYTHASKQCYQPLVFSIHSVKNSLDDGQWLDQLACGACM